jgi:hypothetical protein
MEDSFVAGGDQPRRKPTLKAMTTEGFGVVARRPVRGDLPARRGLGSVTDTGSQDHGVLYAP